MNILVTGGAGFVGQNLVHALIKEGHNVSILDFLAPQVHANFQRRIKEYWAKKNVKFYDMNICDKDVLVALNGIDVIYHLASRVGVGQSQYKILDYVNTNINGTANLLQQCLHYKHHIKKIIVASSMSIYGEGTRIGGVRESMDITMTTQHSSVYGLTKYVQEKLVLLFGKIYKIDTIALRYFNIYGPGQAINNPYTGVINIFLNRLKSGQPPIIYGDGSQTRDFIHIDDVTRANLLALKYIPINDERVFNVGTGKRTTILDVARNLCLLVNKSIEPVITYKHRKGDIQHCVADTIKARAILGFTTQVELGDGFRDLKIMLDEEQPIIHDQFELAQGELNQFRLLEQDNENIDI